MDADDVSNSFDRSYEKLKRLNDDDISGLNAIIDDLNSVNYQNVQQDNSVLEDVILRFMKFLTVSNDHIISKFCHLVQSYVQKLKVSLKDETLVSLVDIVLGFLKICRTWIQADILHTLSTLLHKNAFRLQEFHGCLIGHEGVLLELVGNNDLNICYSALKCIQSLTTKGPEDLNFEESQLSNVCSICTVNLTPNIVHIDNSTSCKIILCCLKCVHNIFPMKTSPVENLGELLGLIKALLYFGFPGQTVINPVTLYPTLMAGQIPQLRFNSKDSKETNTQFQRHKAHKVRSKKKKFGKPQPERTCSINDEDSDSNYRTASYNVQQGNNNSDLSDHWQASSSGSDLSDFEENNILKLKNRQSSVRQHAYVALHSIVRSTDKRLVFSYWSSFIPDSVSSVGTNNLNIFTTILKDPSQQVRLCAVGVLIDFLKGSKQFLSLVDDKGISTSSFISASSVVTSMVVELHRCLLLALISETSPPLLTQILKCYAVIVDNVPYQRLNVEILLKLLSHLKPFLNHKDLQVQVACLTVFGSLLNSEQVPEKVTNQIITVSEKSAEDNSGNNTNRYTNPWIVDMCRNNLRNNSSLPIQIESLQILVVVVSRHFSAIRKNMTMLHDIIITCLENSHFLLQLHSAKLLEVLGRGILNDVNSQSTNSSTFNTDENLESILNFWVRLLSGPFSICLMKDEQPTLKSVSCDCLSTVLPDVFEKLPQKSQIFCLTILFGLSSDSDQGIRSAAIRCLGVFCLFPYLREDLAFLSDVSRVLTEAVKDSMVLVRTKASWAMGNLTDALFLSRDQYPGFTDSITPTFIYSIGMASVYSSNDCDRIKASAVRALGNLLNFLPSSFLDDEKIQEFIKEAISSLISTLKVKIMKVCWNACHALGNVLKSKDLIQSGILDLNKILNCLVSALTSSNFKVRINAVSALSQLQSRKLYGDEYVPIFLRIINTLSSAEADVDFKELKHFENLQDSICYSVCQFLVLVTIFDLNELHDGFYSVSELLLRSMWKFGEKATEEKMCRVNSALDHISSLINETQELNSNNQLLDYLQDILNQAKEGYNQR